MVKTGAFWRRPSLLDVKKILWVRSLLHWHRGGVNGGRNISELGWEVADKLLGLIAWRLELRIGKATRP